MTFEWKCLTKSDLLHCNSNLLYRDCLVQEGDEISFVFIHIPPRNGVHVHCFALLKEDFEKFQDDYENVYVHFFVHKDDMKEFVNG